MVDEMHRALQTLYSTLLLFLSCEVCLGFVPLAPPHRQRWRQIREITRESLGPDLSSMGHKLVSSFVPKFTFSSQILRVHIYSTRLRFFFLDLNSTNVKYQITCLDWDPRSSNCEWTGVDFCFLAILQVYWVKICVINRYLWPTHLSITELKCQ